MARVEGGGAVSRGDGDALGKQAAKVGGDVKGHLITGNNNVINPDPIQAEAERAKIRYLKRLFQECNVLPLAVIGGEDAMGASPGRGLRGA